jgi:hypothetical protein
VKFLSTESMSLSNLVDELNILIARFNFEEALDKFYDENVVVVENEHVSANGLDAHRIGGKKFLVNTSNRTAMLKNVLISDSITVCEWHYKFDHAEWGHWDKIQLSVQRWENGKIVHERHYYK